MPDDIVITGVGLVTGLGNDVKTVWDALVDGRSAVRPIEAFDASGFQTQTASQIKDLNPIAIGIPRRSTRIMDTHSYALMKATTDALADAGLAGPDVDRNDFAFFAGMGMVDYRIEDFVPAVLRSMDPSSSEMDFDRFYGGAYLEVFPLWPLYMLNNISFCQIAILHGIRGDNTVYSPHAEAGAQALWDASRAVAEGRAPVALAGGTCDKVSPVRLGRDILCGVMSPRGKEASVMPFAKGRDGSVPGEAGAVVIMEKREDAAQRDTRLLAVIRGYGEAFALKDGSRAPMTEAVSAAMEEALTMANLGPKDIDLLIAHGDGTPEGDAQEATAIATVFGSHAMDIPVYSSKPALGHTLAAAPVVDTVLAVSTISEGLIPRTLNAGEPGEDIGFHISQGASDAIVRNVLINCTSIEGQCASIIISAPEN